jgi:naphthalene 1,2-dioxygenase system ferredoxin subunit
MTFEVADSGDVPPGTMMHVEVAGRAVAVYNLDGTFYATDDACTHRAARLSDGFLEGRVVQCPLHFGRFDVITGQPLNAPCTIPVSTYRVTLENGRLLLDLPQA